MKKIKFGIMTFILAIVMLFSSVTVFADLTNEELQAYVDEYGLKKIGSKNYGEGDKTDITQMEVVYDGVKYYITSEGVENAEKHIAKIDKNEQQIEDSTGVLTTIEDFGILPNLEEAMEALDGFKPAINLVLGILVFLVSIGMTLFTMTDVCYILFPMFRGRLDDAKQNGDKASGFLDKIVSDEARHSVRTAETVETGKNPLVIYFGKRVVAHLVLAILIFVLITGNITIITEIAIKAVSGILRIIQNIGT